jgi:calcineurin-like phosphoesterase
VIGVDPEAAIRRMRTLTPVRLRPAEGGVRLEGCVIDCDAATGRATAIEALRVPFP